MSAPRTKLPRAVLDSNVIFSRVLHELLGRIAREARAFDLVWSDELLDEAKRVLVEDKPVSEPVAERWVSYLRDAFPNGRINIAAIPADVDLSGLTTDPDDEHICALALAGDVQLLITFDESFAHATLLEHGVTVTKPDAVLAPAFDEQPGLFLAILERQAAAWGARTLAELLDALERANVPVFVSKVRAALAARTMVTESSTMVPDGAADRVHAIQALVPHPVVAVPSSVNGARARTRCVATVRRIPSGPRTRSKPPVRAPAGPSSLSTSAKSPAKRQC